MRTSKFAFEIYWPLVIGHLSYLHNRINIFMKSHFVFHRLRKHQYDIIKELTPFWAIWVCMRKNILHSLRIRSWIIHTIRCKYVLATFFNASVFAIHAYLAAKEIGDEEPCYSTKILISLSFGLVLLLYTKQAQYNEGFAKLNYSLPEV